MRILPIGAPAVVEPFAAQGKPASQPFSVVIRDNYNAHWDGEGTGWYIVERLDDSTQHDALARITLAVDCDWFALCTNEATSLRPHPFLGSVPICDRCNAKIEAL